METTCRSCKKGWVHDPRVEFGKCPYCGLEFAPQEIQDEVMADLTTVLDDVKKGSN